MEHLKDEIFASTLFSKRPVFAFWSTQTGCPLCQSELKVLKTHAKTVTTTHIGSFTARETQLYCDQCHDGTVYHSQDLPRLVPNGCSFGYDVMIHIGQALFLRHRNHKEIIEELFSKNIRISSSEIDHLGKKFITYLAIAHRQNAGRLKTTLNRNGGYILHLDGTFEHKAPVLMTGMDSISKLVLGNVKLPSEKSDKIIPFLKDIRAMFGSPLALVHDMGRGIIKAVEAVFPDTLDFICHFHFLRDIGKDLLGSEYTVIRKNLKNHGIASKLRLRARTLKNVIDDNPQSIDLFCDRFGNPAVMPNNETSLFSVVMAYSLIQWALDGKNQGQGYGFPFDHPHLLFARRIRLLYDQIEKRMCSGYESEKPKNKHFRLILKDLEPVVNNPVLSQAIDEVNSKITVFEKLRDAMRIAPISGQDGLNCDGSASNMKTIENRVRRFCTWLSLQKNLTEKAEIHNLIKQLNKYWEKLFADPITVFTPAGKKTVQPQRTNNIMERFFRDLRRGNRRKTGNNSMSRALRSILADTPLVKNLENREYMDILLDGKSSLEELFADIDSKLVRKELKNANRSPDKIPTKIKKMILKPVFFEIALDAIN